MNRAIMLCAGLAVLASGGCVIAIDADEDDVDVHYMGGSRLERVYAGAFTEDGLRVRVASNGCTSEDSFQVDVHEDRDDDFEVRLRRKNPDRCDAYDADGVELIYSWTELGLPSDASVTILNPIGR